MRRIQDNSCVPRRRGYRESARERHNSVTHPCLRQPENVCSAMTADAGLIVNRNERAASQARTRQKLALRRQTRLESHTTRWAVDPHTLVAALTGFTGTDRALHGVERVEVLTAVLAAGQSRVIAPHADPHGNFRSAERALRFPELVHLPSRSASRPTSSTASALTGVSDRNRLFASSMNLRVVYIKSRRPPDASANSCTSSGRGPMVRPLNRHHQSSFSSSVSRINGTSASSARSIA